MSDTTDPTSLGGDISGPGGPHERDGVVVDTTNAVLLDTTTVAMVALGEVEAVALLLEGRVNKRLDRAKVLVLMPNEGAAEMIVEVLGLLERMAPEAQVSFLAAVRDALGALP